MSKMRRIGVRFIYSLRYLLWSNAITLIFMCSVPPSGHGHAWSGKSIVLFVTYEIRPQEIRGVLGLPSPLLLRSLPQKPRSLGTLLQNPQGYAQLVQELRQVLQRDLPLKIDQRLSTPRLSRVDLILARTPLSIRDKGHSTSPLKSKVSSTENSTEESDDAREIKVIDKVVIETHRGVPEAAVINFTIPVTTPPKKIRFLWRSTLWFARRGQRSRRRQLSTRSVSGIIIDQEQITPITFTPREPEVIWRSPQALMPPQRKPDSLRPIVTDASSLTRLQRFKRLHSQIYTAFDHDQDERIYDALSLSLDGGALDQVFTSTYRALILRDQGGARAQVSHVIPLSHQELTTQQISPKLKRYLTQGNTPSGRELARPLKSSRPYLIRYRWRVAGHVTHWGHTHRRVNDYEAIYVMSSTPQGWRITFVEPLSQTRRPELEGSL